MNDDQRAEVTGWLYNLPGVLFCDENDRPTVMLTNVDGDVMSYNVAAMWMSDHLGEWVAEDVLYVVDEARALANAPVRVSRGPRR